MLDAGWTVPMSGSGTGGVYAASNVFNTAQSPKQWSLLPSNGVGVGSEPWGYQYCWIVLEDPSGNRQIMFQRDNSASDGGDDEWWVAYSHAGRFGEGQVAGTDWDATTPAVAPDSYNLLGSSGGWAPYFEPGGSPSMVHVAADDTPSPEGEYGVLALEMKPSRTLNAVFMLDDVRSAPVGHPHPLALFVDSTDSCLTQGNIGGAATPRYANSVIDPGGPGEAFISFYAARVLYGSTNVFPQQGGLGVDNKERAVPLVWGFADNESYMGLSRWLRWQANSQEYPSTAGGRTFLYMNDCVIEDLWDGVTVPVAL